MDLKSWGQKAYSVNVSRKFGDFFLFRRWWVRYMDPGPFKDCERIEYSEQLKMEVSTKNTYKESSNRKEQKT